MFLPKYGFKNKTIALKNYIILSFIRRISIAYSEQKMSVKKNLENFNLHYIIYLQVHFLK